VRCARAGGALHNVLPGRAVMGDGADEEEAHNRCRHGRERRQVEGG
jgi:hypothetical protein